MTIFTILGGIAIALVALAVAGILWLSAKAIEASDGRDL